MGLFGLFKRKEKISVDDELFGHLVLIDEGWAGAFMMNMFEKEHEVEFTVETEGTDSNFSEKQRDSFKKVRQDLRDIESQIEKVIAERYDFVDESELKDSSPLGMHFALDGTVDLTCAIDPEGVELIKIAILPQVKYEYKL